MGARHSLAKVYNIPKIFKVFEIRDIYNYINDSEKKYLLTVHTTHTNFKLINNQVIAQTPSLLTNNLLIADILNIDDEGLDWKNLLIQVPPTDNNRILKYRQ